MTGSPRTDQALRPGSRWLSPILLANLVAEVAIVVTGGLVRVTGSGLGCPTWPECVDGSITPTIEQAEGIHKWIEFGNRTLTGVLGLLALATIVAVWRWAPRRAMKVAAVTVFVGVLVQAVLGGITVLLGLHPATVAAHFLVSMGLVAAASYLWFARHETGAAPVPLVPPIVTRLAWATPLGFHPRTISRLHADVVMLLVGLVVATWLTARLTSKDADRAPGRAWFAVLAVSLAQGVVGYVQYFTNLPEALVIAHMLGATLLVVALTNGILALRRR